jgi:uncharacterized protein YqgC (DUF456 family)
MVKRGMIRPNEFLAVIIIFIGSLGFILWGMGYGLRSSLLIWLGEIIVGIIIVIATFLSRWLK